MDLDEVKREAGALSRAAHVATVGTDGRPDVVPVNPGWDGDTPWFISNARSVKVRNIAANSAVALHWQVTEDDGDQDGDAVMLWGTARFHDDRDTKRRLWTGVFDYDLDQFAPGGPDGSPDAGFVAVTPERALVKKRYGIDGRHAWHRPAPA